MKFLNKKQTKDLHGRMMPPINLYNADRDGFPHSEYQEFLNLMCTIPQWYNKHNVSVNDRGEVRAIHKRKLGTDTYTFVGWVKHTCWGIECSNGVQIILSNSVEGTDLEVYENSDRKLVNAAVEELSDYLYDKNKWYIT